MGLGISSRLARLFSLFCGSGLSLSLGGGVQGLWGHNLQLLSLAVAAREASRSSCPRSAGDWAA